MIHTQLDIPALKALLKANETYIRPFTGLNDPACHLVVAIPELIEAVEERDEWKQKYTAVVMGADPNASGTAKTYWAAVERACDEALTRYKHEAREAQSALAEAEKELAQLKSTLALREIPTSGAKPLDFP